MHFLGRTAKAKTRTMVAAGALSALALTPVVLTAEAAPASAAAAMPSSLTIVGHGWGHGRGMGQFGALGYAQQGWTFQQILGHYYEGTTASNTTVSSIKVSLSELYGASSVTVGAPAGQTLVLDGTNSQKTTLTLTRGHSVTVTNNKDVIVTGPWSTGTTRQFQGSVSMPTGIQNVVNTVSLVQYVEGVVPRESPASWPSAALAAQAVAARSYALAYTNNGAQTICDYAACQMYGGDPTQYDTTYTSNSDAAVTSTGTEVLLCGTDTTCGSASQVAFTEFSSSTGGYTAGGDFPAVPDAGDSTSANPNHDWSTTVATSYVQQAFPSIGTLQSITVTSRNGLGDLGGRVLTMSLTGSSGHETVSGANFADAIGLRSDWFAITTAAAPSGSDQGYWVVASNGSVYPFGNATNDGSMAGKTLAAPIIGMAPTADSKGYWMVAGDGGIFNFGDAKFFGSTGNLRLKKPVIGLAPTTDSKGYWLDASDGGIFTFGDAKFYGSTGGMTLAKPIVSMARTADGKGYWMVASDGGVFNFGDAKFYGSTGKLHLVAPIVGIVPTSDGKGYWLVASDGGVFAFGDAGFVGSLGGQGVNDIVSVSPTPDGGGYLLVTRSGVVYTFGDATYLGDPSTTVNGWEGAAIGVFTS